METTVGDWASICFNYFTSASHVIACGDHPLRSGDRARIDLACSSCGALDIVVLTRRCWLHKREQACAFPSRIDTPVFVASFQTRWLLLILKIIIKSFKVSFVRLPRCELAGIHWPTKNVHVKACLMAVYFKSGISENCISSMAGAASLWRTNLYRLISA